MYVWLVNLIFNDFFPLLKGREIENHYTLFGESNRW